MTTQSLVLELPAETYENLRKAAAQRNRSVEALALEMLAPFLSPPPIDIEAALQAMPAYTDDALWEVIYQRLSAAEQAR